MKTFVVILIIGTLVAFNCATPARKRDIGIKLREQQAQFVRDHTEDHTETQTVIYGNGIPGHEAEIEHYEFNKDDDGNYNFA